MTKDLIPSRDNEAENLEVAQRVNAILKARNVNAKDVPPDQMRTLITQERAKLRAELQVPAPVSDPVPAAARKVTPPAPTTPRKVQKPAPVVPQTAPEIIRGRRWFLGTALAAVGAAIAGPRWLWGSDDERDGKPGETETAEGEGSPIETPQGSSTEQTPGAIEANDPEKALWEKYRLTVIEPNFGIKEDDPEKKQKKREKREKKAKKSKGKLTFYPGLGNNLTTGWAAKGLPKDEESIKEVKLASFQIEEETWQMELETAKAMIRANEMALKTTGVRIARGNGKDGDFRDNSDQDRLFRYSFRKLPIVQKALKSKWKWIREGMKKLIEKAPITELLKWLKKKGVQSFKTASPTNSNHEGGQALDCATNIMHLPILLKHGFKGGLWNGHKDDAWHVSAGTEFDENGNNRFPGTPEALAEILNTFSSEGHFEMFYTLNRDGKLPHDVDQLYLLEKYYQQYPDERPADWQLQNAEERHLAWLDYVAEREKSKK